MDLHVMFPFLRAQREYAASWPLWEAPCRAEEGLDISHCISSANQDATPLRERVVSEVTGEGGAATSVDSVEPQRLNRSCYGVRVENGIDFFHYLPRNFKEVKFVFGR